MPKAYNAVWRFFASVKLALLTLIILAATSIIGTMIKQGQEQSYYVQEYGPNLARFFELLDITNMYGSWWFATLLCLFTVNLVICSLERWPQVWHLVTLDNLSVDPQKLEKMRFTHRIDTSLPAAAIAERMHRFLVRTGWRKPRRLDREEEYILLFAQKGAWTRLGVYVVHLSILIILIGSILGTFLGFRAYVYLPEGRTTDTIFLQKNGESIPLGFALQCDRAERAYYPNGMIREYRTDLTVFDTEREAPYQKSIIVNDPLTYRGFTFYQGDSYPLDEFFFLIRNRTSGMEQAFRVPPDRDVAWQETDVSFRIDELKRDQEGAVQQAKIRFTADVATESSIFWIKDKDTVTIQQSGREFTLSFRQLYSTLLLVTKDPGVLIVYLGCILMVAGLAIIFFLSHRRIWVRITTVPQQGSRILISGASNKNQSAFARHFRELTDRLGGEAEISTGQQTQ
jgi:cytochrome c biogenesis protein